MLIVELEMDNTWLFGFTKEVGMPAIMAVIFIWYFVKVFFPEQRIMMMDSIKLVTKSYQEALDQTNTHSMQLLRQIIDHNEKVLEKIILHNTEVKNSLVKSIDGVVSEMLDIKQDISRRLEDITSKVRTYSQPPSS